MLFIAVGTPPEKDGAPDLSQVLQAALDIGRLVSGHSVVVVKSTVPVGTTQRVHSIVTAELKRRNVNVTVEVAFNPEFLKEGDAVNDFLHPDRVIVGSDNARAIAAVQDLYAPLIQDHTRLLVMGARDAELTKYAANAMLATRISFMNEIAGICERVGVDVEHVRAGIGSDRRIGFAFIHPGCGYGGSCLPKDVRALIRMASDAGFDPAVLRSVQERNQAQRQVLIEKIQARFGVALDGLHFGLWGLAFKPGTDDMREASSISLIGQLLDAGATVSAYDPAAMDTARRVLPAAWFDGSRLSLAAHQYDVAAGADAIVLVTEWEPFRLPDFAALRSALRQPVIFDGRNQYDAASLREEGFEYYGIGRLTGSPAAQAGPRKASGW
jgi:UDPglucose 6-dehydrogenase